MVLGDLPLDLPARLFCFETRLVCKDFLCFKYNLRKSDDQPSHSEQKVTSEHTWPRHDSHFKCVS